MTNDPCVKSRREFLQVAGGAAAVFAAHGSIALAGADRATRGAGNGRRSPLIRELHLQCGAPLEEMRRFYHDGLGLDVIDETDSSLTIACGATPITFERADPSMGKPLYHFAFNIPHNKILGARDWQRERSALVPWLPHQRDDSIPHEDIRHFPNWNSHSVFFFDPAFNIVEHIARHDLKNDAPGPFTSRDILYASEIAFVVDDRNQAARQLGADLKLDVYPKGASFWWAMGDEMGLLLCTPKGTWGETTETPVERAVYPTRARIAPADGRPERYQLGDAPFEIVAD